MIKQTVAALAALPLLASGAAVAGPYVNIEANSGFTGSDYSSTLIENHLGYEGAVGNSETTSWYLQAGPAVSLEDGVDESDTEISGKVGLSTDVTDSVTVYGEYWAMTSDNSTDDLASNVKAGIKWNF